MIEAFISANVSKCSVIHQMNINVGFHVGEGKMVALGTLASAQNSGLRNQLEAKVMDLEDRGGWNHSTEVLTLCLHPALRGHPPVTSGTEQTCV